MITLDDDTDGQDIYCIECEAEYLIVLAEDFLTAPAQYCAFCGETLQVD